MLRKLRIIADDVNFTFTQKKEILDELSEEEIRKSKLPLSAVIETDELANDLRLLIILEIMNTSEETKEEAEDRIQS